MEVKKNEEEEEKEQEAGGRIRVRRRRKGKSVNGSINQRRIKPHSSFHFTLLPPQTLLQRLPESCYGDDENQRYYFLSCLRAS